VRPAVLLSFLLLGGCYAEQDDTHGVMINHGDGRVTVLNHGSTLSVGVGVDPVGAACKAKLQGQNGRVIDLAEALTPAEMQSLSVRLSKLQQTVGRAVMVILIEPQGQSLEQVGWAVGKGVASRRPVMILADPATRQVRIEGELSPEAKAQVAVAMQEGLKAGRAGQAVERGLIRLGEVIA
jgi:hypothetical protein